MNKEQLFQKLNREIPLTRHLGFEIVEASPKRVHLKARLDENINHKGTAFGGSIYTLSVLTAYSLVYLGLDQEKIQTNNIVIQKGEIKYLKPVTADFDIICEFKGQDLYEKFFHSLARWNKVRETLKVQVLCKGAVCAQLEGVFVVHK